MRVVLGKQRGLCKIATDNRGLIRRFLGNLKWKLIEFKKKCLARRLRKQYDEVVNRIRKYSNDKRIKVIFLVNESSKWKTQSLCDEMKRCGRYEVAIALSNADIDWNIDDAGRRARMVSNRLFFENRGFRVLEAYNLSNHEAEDISQYKPDIVFYQHPWSFPDEQMPRKVSSYALTCYVPYFVPSCASLDMYCRQPLHREVFRHFVLNRQWEQYFKSNINSSHYAGEIVGLGHTMLDELQDAGDVSDDGVVIYSPHWSINHPKLQSFLDLSTFLTNGQLILEYVRKHPEVKWAFKPHPTLRVTLHNTGAMSDHEIDAYYKGWEEIGEACYTGDYVGLFRRSRAMITDCDSFLSEYACTQKPIIHLVSSIPNKRTFSPIQFLYDTYYKVHNNDELIKTLDEVVVKGNDFKKKERLSALKMSGLLDVCAAKNILAHIEKIIGVER